jgi:hypothetical protein
LTDALREVEEEIGVAIEEHDLRRLGVRLCASEEEAGILDREIQDVFLLVDNRPLTGYSPHRDELDALICLPITGVLALFENETDVIEATELRPGKRVIDSVALTRSDFIPTIDRYFYKIAIAADRVLDGERHVAV